ncbi:MAG TPA: efflux RND transporter periplasmic adaptor subunit [Kofleriaceae bacterium]|jgi:membrane fusion protein (multidrug efflux system)
MGHARAVLTNLLALAIAVWPCERSAIAGSETSYLATVAAQDAEVSARVDAPIKRVLVHDQQLVKQGQLLIELDDHELRARVSAAQTELAARQTQEHQAEAALATTPPDRLDRARAMVDLDRARVAQAQAALELAQFDAHYTTITAEIRGSITLYATARGDHVQRGQSLARIVDLDDAWIDASFEESKVAHFKVGQDADVVVDAPDHTISLHGTVENVGIDDAALTHAAVDILAPGSKVGIHVKIKLREDPRAKGLSPGMPATVTVHTP